MLGVSRTAYYRYQRGQSYQLTPEKEARKTLVERIFRAHKRRYGSRRIVSELQDEGHQLGRQQVRTLMKEAGLRPIQPKSFVPRTTDSKHSKGYWPNLLLDLPFPTAPNLIWVSDITARAAPLSALGQRRVGLLRGLDGLVLAPSGKLASR